MRREWNSDKGGWEGIVFHNEKHMNCCFVVHYKQSLFFSFSSSENARDAKTEDACDWRHETEEARSVFFFLTPSFLAPTRMVVEGYIINNVYISIVVLAL